MKKRVFKRPDLKEVYLTYLDSKEAVGEMQKAYLQKLNLLHSIEKRIKIKTQALKRKNRLRNKNRNGNSEKIMGVSFQQKSTKKGGSNGKVMKSEDSKANQNSNNSTLIEKKKDNTIKNSLLTQYSSTQLLHGDSTDYLTLHTPFKSNGNYTNSKSGKKEVFFSSDGHHNPNPISRGPSDRYKPLYSSDSLILSDEIEPISNSLENSPKNLKKSENSENLEKEYLQNSSGRMYLNLKKLKLKESEEAQRMLSYKLQLKKDIRDLESEE